MISKFETLSFEQVDEIGQLTINRPQKLNALNIQLLSELKSCLTELARAPLRGLIVTGAGEKAFIAGADIAQMRPMSVGEAEAFSELGQQVTLLFEALPFPTVAAVNGFALGGGFEMALACDFIFSTKNAVFGLPEVKLGLIPGFGGTQRLSRAVGERRALELIFSGRNMTSAEALQLGIVLQVFEHKELLLAGVHGWFTAVLQNSPLAIDRVKQTVKLGLQQTLAQGLRQECIEFGKSFASSDMQEGTAAFLEKRSANFKGK